MTQSVKGLNWTELVSPRVGLPSGIPLCLKNTFCKTCIHLSGGDEDYFSHPRVVGAGSVCGCADGCQSQSMLRRFCGSMDRGWPEHMVRGSLALAFLACLLSSAGAVLLALHILQEKLQGNPAQRPSSRETTAILRHGLWTLLAHASMLRTIMPLIKHSKANLMRYQPCLI